jgi:manganese transport protein
MIASVAYVDPGNFGTDIAGGATYGYTLVWSVVLSSLMAMLLQYLSGKLGIVTGESLATIVREKLKVRSRIIPYWLGSETFAIATDLAEFLGVTSAIHLLFGVPLLISVWI